VKEDATKREVRRLSAQKHKKELDAEKRREKKNC